MSLEALLRKRKMVREYLPTPVPAEPLERVLQAALRGPSAGNSQGVSLVVVQDAERRRALAALSAEDAWVSRGYPAWLSGAPVHVVLCVEPGVYHRRYAEADKEGARKDWMVPFWHVDGGCALMLLLLAAVDEGLAAGFQGAQNLPGLHELLGIPADVCPLGVVTLGYAAPQQPLRGSQGRARRPGRIHREQW
jgi:nitroreductase